MADVISSLPTLPTLEARPPTSLWTPRIIAVMALILGIPGGLSLSIINWLRMGLTTRALNHLVLGIFALVLLNWVSSAVPNEVTIWIAVLANIAALTYFRLQMIRDIERYKANNGQVKNANWILGIVIGVGGFSVYVILFLRFTLIIRSLGIR